MKLSREQHAKFLDEEPHDPVTGDLLLEGDEIVICASCKTAFLRESWLYMGEKHCNQSNTLDHVPLRKNALKLLGGLREKMKKVKTFAPVPFGKRFTAFMTDFVISLFFTPLGAPFYWLLKDAWGQSIGKKLTNLDTVEVGDEIAKTSTTKRILRNVPTSLPLFWLLTVFQDNLLESEILTGLLIFGLGLSSLVVYALEGIAAMNGEDRLTDVLLGVKLAEKNEIASKTEDFKDIQKKLSEGDGE